MINYKHGVYLDSIDAVPQETLRMWRNDPNIRRWCREYRLITKGMQNSWLNSLDDRNLMFSVWCRNEIGGWGTESFPVGACGLTNIHPTHRAGELSIYIAPEFQRQGYARAAIKTLVDYGFKEANLHRIWGETFYGNPAMNLYEELGFKSEGVLKEAYYKDGKWIDAYIFAKIS